MSVQTYVPGPAELYVHDGSTWGFLGYSESGARIQWIRHFEDVMNDKSGPRMPADKQYMGEEALISCDLKLFDHSVWNVARRNIRGRAFGSGSFGDLGSLMIQQNHAYRLNVRQPYSSAAVWGGQNKFPNMTENYHFWFAFMIDESEPVSTKAKVIPVVWQAMTYVNPCTGVHTFFDTSPGSLPSAC